MGKHSADDGDRIKEKKSKKEKQKNKVAGKISKLGAITRIILLVSSIVLAYTVIKINIVPLKYIMTGIAVLFLINLIFFIILIKNKKNVFIKVVSGLLALAISAVFIFASYQINQGSDLLEDLNLTYKTLNFSVIVRADSDYYEMSDLSEKSLGYFNNGAEGMQESLDVINDVNSEIVTVGYNNLTTMGLDLLDGNIESLVIEDGYKAILTDPDGNGEDGEAEATDDDEEDDTEEDEDVDIEEIDESLQDDRDTSVLENFEDEDVTRVIYTFSINLDLVDTINDVSVTEETFNIYISGIDTYGSIASVSRSDVNIVATVNPTTKQILLTSIPRDYYVKLHGTTGYKDKLTHAGIYGVDMSVKTIEDLLDIDINYYVKFNFTSVVKIVNAIGGVDVYSEYNFTSVKGGYNFKKGYNHVNGKQALAFVRERKAFSSGDRQRGKNQQAMIDAIANKCMTPAILTKYSTLLNELKSTFVTNMPTDRITSLIKMQLNDGSTWNISTNSLTGVDAKQYTYSYSGSPLYVMVPYQSSIDAAKDLIQKVFDGEILDKAYETSGGATVYSVTQTIIENEIENEVVEEITNDIVEDNTTNTIDEEEQNTTDTNPTDTTTGGNDDGENQPIDPGSPGSGNNETGTGDASGGGDTELPTDPTEENGV